MKIFPLLLVAACSSSPSTSSSVPAVPAPATPAVSRTPSTAPSIYDLPVALRDASGADVGLDAQRGRPVLVAMFYASCPVACPVLVHEIGETLAEIGRDDIRVMLISFDPARDTPDKLRDVIATRRLDERWTVAAASESDARALAAVLGVKYRKLDSGEFYHSATIVALDEEGRPIARTDVASDHLALVSALR